MSEDRPQVEAPPSADQAATASFPLPPPPQAVTEEAPQVQGALAADQAFAAPVPAPAAPQAERCTNCSAVMPPGASYCAHCNAPRLTATNYCWHCGTQLVPGQQMCSRCGAGLYGDAARAGANGAVESKRIIAALCAFFLGAFGVHKFVLNRTGQGLLRLGITIIGGIVTLGLAAAAMSVIGMIEGVIYFTKTDADFIRIYQVGDKAWF